MKKIWHYIAIAAACFFAAACVPEYPHVNQGQLPQASEFQIQIDVDQETNFVTFNLLNEGMTPIWIFGNEQLIDGKQNKKYSYTGNGIKLRFREAGEYSVEVKAYNASGTSVGSVVKTFTLNNTYRDPFDPTPYIRALSGGASQDWVWNSTEAGHFGCGETVANPKGWWSCDANGKTGFLYDDVLTFDSEGQYTFTPADGKAYANKGSEYSVESKTADEDYLFPAETKTTKFTFENSWTDEGIEEIYLVFDPGTIVSYVPHKSLVENPRFLVVESKPANMKKKLQLVAFVNTPDNPNGIAWYYEFVPKGSNAGSADPLFGLDSKTWVLDNETAGYMGCGSSFDNPTEWWSAAPHDKDAWGVKDDEITFFANGKYIFDPGADGVIYVNKDTGYHSELATGEDYDAPAQKQESTYTQGSDNIADYIELPAGILFGYAPNAAVFDDQPNRLHVKELTENKLVVVTVYEGISWQFIYRPKDGGAQGGGDGDAEFDINGAGNMWNSMTYEMSFYTSHGPSWEGLPNSGFQADDANHVYTVDMPEATDNQWQRQVAFHTTMSSSASKTYDFCCTVTPTKDLPGVTFKLVLDGGGDNDKIFFFEERLPLAAGEDFVFKKTNMNGIDMDKIALFFDFGGNTEDTQAVIKDICFQEHKGGVPITVGDLEDVLVGTWTWDPDQAGHFGCGPELGNPVGWWKGDAHCKDNAHMYDDTITFTADGKYTLDPVDGFSYMNKDVTFLNDRKGESPYGDDFCFTNTKTTWNYTLDEVGDYQVIKLADGGLFSYIPNNDFENEPWLYVKSFTNDQLILMTYTATGNNGGAIAWQYIFKRVK